MTKFKFGLKVGLVGFRFIWRQAREQGLKARIWLVDKHVIKWLYKGANFLFLVFDIEEKLCSHFVCNWHPSIQGVVLAWKPFRFVHEKWQILKEISSVFFHFCLFWSTKPIRARKSFQRFRNASLILHNGHVSVGELKAEVQVGGAWATMENTRINPLLRSVIAMPYLQVSITLLIPSISSKTYSYMLFKHSLIRWLLEWKILYDHAYFLSIFSGCWNCFRSSHIHCTFIFGHQSHHLIFIMRTNLYIAHHEVNDGFQSGSGSWKLRTIWTWNGWMRWAHHLPRLCLAQAGKITNKTSNDSGSRVYCNGRSLLQVCLMHYAVLVKLDKLCRNKQSSLKSVIWNL